MAEMVGLSRTAARRGSALGLIALIRTVWRKRPGSSTRIHTEAWSDYMLRDIGLNRELGGPASLFDWRAR